MVAFAEMSVDRYHHGSLDGRSIEVSVNFSSYGISRVRIEESRGERIRLLEGELLGMFGPHGPHSLDVAMGKYHSCL